MRSENERKERASGGSAQTIASPTARASGGSHSHTPSQDTARNRPTTVASAASGGHSRSQKIVQRARLSAAASSVARRAGGPPGAGSGKVASVNKVSATAPLVPDNTVT